MSDLKLMAMTVLAALKIRFLNLRTVEGGLYVSYGLVLLSAAILSTMLGVDVVRFIAGSLLMVGAYKFLTMG